MKQVRLRCRELSSIGGDDPSAVIGATPNDDRTGLQIWRDVAEREPRDSREIAERAAARQRLFLSMLQSLLLPASRDPASIASSHRDSSSHRPPRRSASLLLARWVCELRPRLRGRQVLELVLS